MLESNMARKKIREYDAKQLVKENATVPVEVRSFLITPEISLEDVPDWVKQEQLVVKPDQLFGKRKKHGLVLVNATWEEAKSWVEEKRNKEVTIGKATDVLTHFLVESFVPHEKEYYIAFKSERDNDIIYYSEQGGIDIEENWDNVTEIKVPVLEEVSELNIGGEIESFIKDMFRIYRELDFAYLEFNPFTIKDGVVHILDTVAQVDDCASFKNMQKWNFAFPREFGKKQYKEEEHIAELDRKSGASLKLTVLNPHGKIWNVLGGGGASIIYLDMIANLGKGEEIANYGEASGNPSEDESYEYAKAILQLMIDNGGKYLFIVGGIANFTDVKKTFKGYIRALQEQGSALREKGITIFIRRGGPNWEKGLASISTACEQIGVKHYVHGPETSMPQIIQIAQGEL